MPKRLVLYGWTIVTIFAVAFIVVGTSRPQAGRIVERKALGEGRFAVELLSAPYQLDRVYMSMQGPRSNLPGIRLAQDADDAETIWLTGVESRMVDAKTLAGESNDYFCHANLTLNPDTTNPQRHNASLGNAAHADWRFFTLIPGRMEMHLPEGFGLPVKNGTLLDYFTMSLNQNPGQPERTVRVSTQVYYRRQVDGGPPIRPLFRRALYVYQQHEDDPARLLSLGSNHDGRHQGELCGTICPANQRGATPSLFAAVGDLDGHPGASCCVKSASQGGIVDQFGPENTIHWMVPPGRHRYRTEVTEQLDLPFDTTVHYVTGHLHPFGESLKLVDIQTKTVLLDVSAESFSDRLGVAKMSELHSRGGIPIYQGRRYELLAQYNNTSGGPIDAMAILYFYALDEPRGGATPGDLAGK